jgi:membrane protease YdiL (CAAX protease family)
MPDLPQGSLKYLLLITVPIVGGIVYHIAVALDLRKAGGRVETRHFGVPDLLFGSVVAAFFTWGGLDSLLKRAAPAADAKEDHLLEGALFMVLVVVATLGFARLREIPVRAFGWVTESFSKMFLRAASSLGMALPIVWAANVATQYIAPQGSQEQDIVTMFRRAAGDGDLGAVRITCLSALLVAPLVEETVFRGYLYPIAKAYMGALAAAMLTSTMFAVSHGNWAVLPGLFVLALAFTIAFERFGSLWVCVAMHAAFNAVSLILIYLQSQGWIPP